MPTTPTPGAVRAAKRLCGWHPIEPDYRVFARIIDEETRLPEMLAALKFHVSWIMRDGSPCCCPAGINEDEPKGKMPAQHSTACQMIRDVLAAIKD